MNRFLALAATQAIIWLAAVLLVRTVPAGKAPLITLGTALIPALPLIFMYPAGAGDIYAYIAEADLVLRYGANPFAVSVSAFPEHPLLPFLDYPNETTHYGPLWIVLAVGLRLVAGSDLLTTLVVFKVFSTLSLFLVAWLCYLSLSRDNGARASTAAMLLAWNPLLLFEFAGNGHNDIVMMAFVALAFLLQTRQRPRGALVALIAASLVKYIAVILLPLFVIVWLRQAPTWQKWLRTAILDGVAAALLGASLLAVTGVEGTIGVLQKMGEWYTTSLGAVTYYQMLESLPPVEAAEIVTRLARYTFLTLYSVAAALLWWRPSLLMHASLWSMVTFMAVATVWFQPWYVSWALPLAVLAGGLPALGALAGLSAGGFGIHAVMGFAWRMNWNHSDLVAIHTAGALAMWLPVFTGAAIGLMFQHFRGLGVHRALLKHIEEVRKGSRPN